MYEIDDEVVLSTRNISMKEHLLSKLRRHWIGPYRLRIGSALSLPDPSYLSCIKLEKVPPVQGMRREERPPSPIVFDSGEEYEVNAILRHKGEGACHL